MFKQLKIFDSVVGPGIEFNDFDCSESFLITDEKLVSAV
jgi:hypothetical protein